MEDKAQKLITSVCQFLALVVVVALILGQYLALLPPVQESQLGFWERWRVSDQSKRRCRTLMEVEGLTEEQQHQLEQLAQELGM